MFEANQNSDLKVDQMLLNNKQNKNTKNLLSPWEPLCIKQLGFYKIPLAKLRLK